MVFTRSRPSTRQRHAVEFTLLAIGDWLPRLVGGAGGGPQWRRPDAEYLEIVGNRATRGPQS